MGKQKNIPSLRFPEFTDEWETNKLEKHIVEHRGGAPLTPSDFDKLSSCEVVPKKGITSGGELILDIEQPTFCTESFFKKYNKSVVDNSFLLTTLRDLVPSGPNIGYIVKNKSDKKYMLAQGVYGLKIDENNLIEQFLIQLSNTKSYRTLMQTIMVGSTQVHIRNSIFFEINIISPTLPEQTKIATFLTTVDKRLAQLKQKKTLLVKYKKGVMQKIFDQEIRFKDDDGNEFPDWEEKTLSEIAVKKIVKNKDNNVKNVFTNSASQGIVNQRDFFDKDIANQNNLLNYYVVENNDFIYNPRISNYAPVGPISRNHLQSGVMSPLYSVFTFTQGSLDFFEIYFSTTDWHEYMKSIANYGARADRMSFSTGDFYLMPLPFPCIAEQTKIAKFLSSIDEKINCCIDQISKTEQYKKGLLQQMFV